MLTINIFFHNYSFSAISFERLNLHSWLKEYLTASTLKCSYYVVEFYCFYFLAKECLDGWVPLFDVSPTLIYTDELSSLFTMCKFVLS